MQRFPWLKHRIAILSIRYNVAARNADHFVYRNLRKIEYFSNIKNCQFDDYSFKC